MKKIRNFSRQSPILFGIGFTLLVILVHELFSSVCSLLPESLVSLYIEELTFIVWPTALVLLFGFGFIFRQKGFGATIGAGLFRFLPSALWVIFQLFALCFTPGIEWKSDGEIILGVLMLVGVGFREEILFRGVITNAIARKYADSTKGIWITVLSSSALFGAMHMGNVFHGVTFQSALIQSISAIGGGAFFCAVYLRGGSIWAAALLHSVYNATATVDWLFTNSSGDLSSTINGLGLQHAVLIVFDLLLVAFLLRKSKRQRILDRMQQLNESLG